jgi:hypothetical protein
LEDLAAGVAAETLVAFAVFADFNGLNLAVVTGHVSLAFHGRLAHNAECRRPEVSNRFWFSKALIVTSYQRLIY